MISKTWLPGAAFIGVVLTAACGGGLRAVHTTVTPPAAINKAPVPAPTITALPAPDSVTILIGDSQRHFADGERELGLGHLEQARKAFDAAIDVLLQSPYGARSEPRIREHFDRLVERISAYEVTALAQGDGFVEKKYAPASIDELLTLSTFDQPAPTTALQNTVETDLQLTQHDVDIPLNSKVLSYIELFQTRLHDWFDEG